MPCWQGHVIELALQHVACQSWRFCCLESKGRLVYPTLGVKMRAGFLHAESNPRAWRDHSCGALQGGFVTVHKQQVLGVAFS